MKKTFIFTLAILTSAVICNAAGNILIKGGTVYDGTVNDPVITDVLIKGDKIIAIGNSAKFKGKIANKDHIFIHATGKNGNLGTRNSTGCLLILDSQWEDFNKHLEGIRSFITIINRTNRAH